MAKRRSKASKRQRREQKLAGIKAAFPTLRAQAEALGLSMYYTAVGGKRQNTWHVQFNHQGRRMLDWWPTNGTWRVPATGEKGKSKDGCEVVQLAHTATLLALPEKTTAAF